MTAAKAAARFFDAQVTFVLPFSGGGSWGGEERCKAGEANTAKEEGGRFVMMADRWVADDLSSSRYVWLPMWAGSRRTEADPLVRRLAPEQRPAWADPPALRWFDEWDLSMLEGEPILA